MSHTSVVALLHRGLISASWASRVRSDWCESGTRGPCNLTRRSDWTHWLRAISHRGLRWRLLNCCSLIGIEDSRVRLRHLLIGVEVTHRRLSHWTWLVHVDWRVHDWRRWQSRRCGTNVPNRTRTRSMSRTDWSLHRFGSFDWGRSFERSFTRMWLIRCAIAIVYNSCVRDRGRILLRRRSVIGNRLLDWLLHRLIHDRLLLRLSYFLVPLYRLDNMTWLILNRSRSAWISIHGTLVRISTDIRLLLLPVIVVGTSTMALVIALNHTHSFNLERKLR